MSEKKPPVIRSVRAVCPVCKHPSYSSTGVHPQCMQKVNDLRESRQTAARLDAAGVLGSSSIDG